MIYIYSYSIYLRIKSKLKVETTIKNQYSIDTLIDFDIWCFMALFNFAFTPFLFLLDPYSSFTQTSQHVLESVCLGQSGKSGIIRIHSLLYLK